MEKITFKPFSKKDLPLYRVWADKPHVESTWFLEGYESKDAILEKLEGNGYDYPFIILLGERPIGYIIYCDLYAYKTIHQNPSGVFADEPKGTYCIDLFIGEEDCLGKGIGTKVMEEFSNMLLRRPEVERLVIDPASDNLRAIRVYEKVGFRPIDHGHDGVGEVLILEKRNRD